MTAQAVVLKGGQVVDPAQGINGVVDVRIEGNRIAAVGAELPLDGATRVDMPGALVVCPGFIDMHVHFREPGQEHKETIATGAAAAVAGGFVAAACMPNTDPVNDHVGVTEEIVRKAAQAGLARVYPIGAVSVGSQGERMTEVRALRDAGCVGISDDGHPVGSALLMRRALEYASMFEMPVINHCEEPTLAAGGVVHEGYQATVLGLRGQPGETESIMVERDVSLSGLTGGAVHVAHMSARPSLRAVRSGKDRGIAVTCEVTPHHFILTDEDLRYDTNFKMNPPLRAVADRDAMVEGLADGSIDAIATDHAPHHAERVSPLDFGGVVGVPAQLGLVDLPDVEVHPQPVHHRGHVLLSRTFVALPRGDGHQPGKRFEQPDFVDGSQNRLRDTIGRHHVILSDQVV